MNLGFLLPDLGSRLRGLPAFYIQPPSDELLQAILMKLMNDRQLMVNPEMIHYLLPRMDRSFAAAQSLVKAIDEYSLAHHRKITIPLLRDVLYNAYKDESPFTG
jgi:chromosomal replication initiation ATPase DnaA